MCNIVPSPPSEIMTSPLRSLISTPFSPRKFAVTLSNSKSSTNPMTFLISLGYFPAWY